MAKEWSCIYVIFLQHKNYKLLQNQFSFSDLKKLMWICFKHDQTVTLTLTCIFPQGWHCTESIRTCFVGNDLKFHWPPGKQNSLVWKSNLCYSIYNSFKLCVIFCHLYFLLIITLTPFGIFIYSCSNKQNKKGDKYINLKITIRKKHL